MDGSKPEPIPTNLRLLAVIERVARAGSPVTPTEVNAELGLPKPTIHRLFATLTEAGYLQPQPDQAGFGPGPRLRGLTTAVLEFEPLRAARLAILRQVSQSLGETCNIALADGDSMVYLERVETDWPLRIQLPPGSRFPLYCTASGKMHLSQLPERGIQTYLKTTKLVPLTSATLTQPGTLLQELRQIQTQGFALDREEFMDGMEALAVPIRGQTGTRIATLSVHGPVQRQTIDRALAVLPDLQAAADALSAQFVA